MNETEKRLTAHLEKQESVLKSQFEYGKDALTSFFHSKIGAKAQSVEKPGQPDMKSTIEKWQK